MGVGAMYGAPWGGMANGGGMGGWGAGMGMYGGSGTSVGYLGIEAQLLQANTIDNMNNNNTMGAIYNEGQAIKVQQADHFGRLSTEVVATSAQNNAKAIELNKDAVIANMQGQLSLQKQLSDGFCSVKQDIASLSKDQAVSAAIIERDVSNSTLSTQININNSQNVLAALQNASTSAVLAQGAQTQALIVAEGLLSLLGGAGALGLGARR